jgi:uncharacterized membrane protein
LSQTQLLADFQKNVIDPARASSSAGTYYDESAYEKYNITVAPPDVVPPTAMGKALGSIGINVNALNSGFRQASAKLLQILIALGFLYVVFRSRFLKKPIDMEFMLLSAGSLILLVAMVVLPVLSVEYGVLRAFQQSLMVLGIFVVVGNLVLIPLLKIRTRIMIVGFLAVVFFWSETGVFTQLFGGDNPLLHLNNNGLYYDIYYSHGTELAGIDWLGNVAQEDGEVQTETQSDFYSVQKVESITDLNPLNDIYPGLIRQDSYVFLGYTITQKQEATITYSGSQITYTYPIQFLDDNKDLVYNNGGVKIYR